MTYISGSAGSVDRIGVLWTAGGGMAGCAGYSLQVPQPQLQTQRQTAFSPASPRRRVMLAPQKHMFSDPVPVFVPLFLLGREETGRLERRFSLSSAVLAAGLYDDEAEEDEEDEVEEEEDDLDAEDEEDSEDEFEDDEDPDDPDDDDVIIEDDDEEEEDEDDDDEEDEEDDNDEGEDDSHFVQRIMSS